MRSGPPRIYEIEPIELVLVKEFTWHGLTVNLKVIVYLKTVKPPEIFGISKELVMMAS